MSDEIPPFLTQQACPRQRARRWSRKITQHYEKQLAEARDRAERAEAEAERLRGVTKELVDALDEIDVEAERAHANGGNGWSSVPVVRSLYARKAARAELEGGKDANQQTREREKGEE